MYPIAPRPPCPGPPPGSTVQFPVNVSYSPRFLDAEFPLRERPLGLALSKTLAKTMVVARARSPACLGPCRRHSRPLGSGSAEIGAGFRTKQKIREYYEQRHVNQQCLRRVEA